MPGDPLRNLVSGERLSGIDSGSWNAFVEAAKFARTKQLGLRADKTPHYEEPDVVLVKNDTETDVDRYGVLAIREPLVSTADNLSEFQQHVQFRCEVPTADDVGRFVVMLEAVPAGKIGRAVIAGVIQCQIYAASEDDMPLYADVLADDATALQVAENGSAQILYRDSGTGSQWGIVRFGNKREEAFYVGATETLSPFSFATCTIQRWNGSSWEGTSRNIEVYNPYTFDMGAANFPAVLDSQTGIWLAVLDQTQSSTPPAPAVCLASFYGNSTNQITAAATPQTTVIAADAANGGCVSVTSNIMTAAAGTYRIDLVPAWQPNSGNCPAVIRDWIEESTDGGSTWHTLNYSIIWNHFLLQYDGTTTTLTIHARSGISFPLVVSSGSNQYRARSQVDTFMLSSGRTTVAETPNGQGGGSWSLHWTKIA